MYTDMIAHCSSNPADESAQCEEGCSADLNFVNFIDCKGSATNVKYDDFTQVCVEFMLRLDIQHRCRTKNYILNFTIYVVLINQLMQQLKLGS